MGATLKPPLKHRTAEVSADLLKFLKSVQQVRKAA
jgi:hypothetical protein